MKLIAPDYYNSFSCIADRCRNSCCIGWEIDIDEDTAEYYKTLSGELGVKLKNCIAEDPSGSSFILSEEERCPFLTREGLCDIILQLGEDSLCQICSDHPRFRNYFSDRTEIGLGLCCEAAAQLILGKKEKARLEILCDDGDGEELSAEDAAVINLRDELIETAQDRTKSILFRLESLLSRYSAKLSDATVPASQMLALEQLSRTWTDRLLALKEYEGISRAKGFSDYAHILDRNSTIFEQLLVYLLFRHIPDAAESGKLREYLLFIVSSVILPVRIFDALYPAEDLPDEEGLMDIIREWSAEIEYSDENIERLLCFFQKETPGKKEDQ